MENYHDSPKQYHQSHFITDNRNIPKMEVDLISIEKKMELYQNRRNFEPEWCELAQKELVGEKYND